MDTGSSNTITVHKHDGTTIVFTENNEGLYIHDTGIPSSILPAVKGHSFLETVAQNNSFFHST
jgi:hypothetical protein